MEIEIPGGIRLVVSRFVMGLVFLTWILNRIMAADYGFGLIVDCGSCRLDPVAEAFVSFLRGLHCLR